MPFQPFQMLSGRVADTYLSKGTLIFSLNGKFVGMDVPGSTQPPFTDGADVDVVVRHGIILRSDLTGLAFRIRPGGVARPAGRWREMIFFLLGAIGLCALVTIGVFTGIWSKDWQAWALSVAAFLYGGYKLWQIGVAKNLLESTPNASLERTLEG